MNSVSLTTQWVSSTGTTEYSMMFISGDRGLGIFICICLFLVKAGNEILRMVIKQMIIDTEHKDKMEMARMINSKWWLEAFAMCCIGTFLTWLFTAFTSLSVVFIILFNFTLENWNPPISPNPLRDILTRAPLLGSGTLLPWYLEKEGMVTDNLFSWTIFPPLIWSLVHTSN